MPVTADQLAGWAADAGLRLTCNDVDSVAEKITDTLEMYPLWALIEQRRDAPAPIREWCKQVSEQASDLLYALGSGLTERGTGANHNALLHLHPGWDQKDEKDGYALSQLDRLAFLAAPDRWRQLQSEGRETPGRDVFGNAGYERLAASLRLLEKLARRAAEHHGQIEAPGGKGRGGARLGLFIDLSRAYRELFGALPTVARQRRQDDADSFRNAGPSWRFFHLLLGHVKAAAQQELDCLSAGSADDVRAGWMELVRAASTTFGMAGEGDPLAHLLRTSASIIRAADKRPDTRGKAQKSTE